MNEKAKTPIRVLSAAALDEARLRSIGAIIARDLQLSDYELSAETDASLREGFVVYAAGRRYDFSLRGRLEAMERELDRLGVPGSEEQTQGQDAEAIRSDLRRMRAALEGGTDQARADGERSAIVDEVGEVLMVGDGIAYVSDLEHCENEELLEFSEDCYGIAMNLEASRVGVILLGDVNAVRAGDICKRTGRRLSVPGGDGLLGRVVDPLGRPLDGAGPIRAPRLYPVERPAPSVTERQPVKKPLYTGITAIDAMTPIGRGQRELIIGDRQTGKTTIGIDSILNQKGKGTRCIYAAIGQKLSTLAQVVETLRESGAMEYTTVLIASASDPASLQYIAPFAACALAESWMDDERCDVLVVYDDLTKHAQAYRALSLLLRRPPGREAFPGDIFYLHSRLLERACRLSEERGGGSITALPIVETQAGDISAYIPTNLISITDGQIYLESDLFYSGQRPAINVGLSVSRVGGAAQAEAMRKVAGSLRISLAQYKEVESFSQFGSELDEETRRQLSRGAALNEVLVQGPRQARTMAESVALLYLATESAFEDLRKEEIKYFCRDLLRYLKASMGAELEALDAEGRLSEATCARLRESCARFAKIWKNEDGVDT